MKKNLLTLKMAVLLMGIFFSTTASAFTAITSGNWSNPATWGGVGPSGTVSNQDIIIPMGITVTLDQDVTFSGFLNTFTVDGTLSSNTAESLILSSGSFGGTGTVDIDRIEFQLLTTANYTGTLNVDTLVNSSTALSLTAITSVSDMLVLESGNLLLNTNGNLTMLMNSTIRINDGTMTINGGIINLTNNYDVIYVGVTKTTGIELNSLTLQNLYLNMNSGAEIVTLASNAIINGNLDMGSGDLALNGNQLTLKGDMMATAGNSIISTNTSNLIIEGTDTLSSNLMFEAGSSINNLVINRPDSGAVKIGSPITVTYLNLTEGSLSLEVGANLIMAAGGTVHVENGRMTTNTGAFDGTAAYNVEYMGISNVFSGAELTGTALTDLTINYTSPLNFVNIMNNVTVLGSLNMMSGGLGLYANNLMLNGTLNTNSNSEIIGNPASELHLNLTSVTGDTIYFHEAGLINHTLSKLVVNTSGTGTVVLGSLLNIENELSFMSGKLELAYDTLTINPTASVTGYSDTKYIVTSDSSGSVAMNVVAGSSYVTFPVGTSSNYSPAYIQQNVGASTGNFDVRSMNTVLAQGDSGFVSSSIAKVVDRTWFINSSAITTNANIKLGWVAASEVNGFDRTDAYISHYTSSAWDMIAAGSASAGPNNTFELTRNAITSFSPFAVIENGEAVKIKEVVQANDFEVYPNPSKDVVNMKMAGSALGYKYELVDVTGRIVLSNKANNLNQFEVAGLENGCYFIKVTNLSNDKIVTKRFIKG